MNYCLDKVEYRNNKVTVRGWAAPRQPGAAFSVSLTGHDGKVIPSEYVITSRPDVGESVYQDAGFDRCGFVLTAEYRDDAAQKVVLQAEEDADLVLVDLDPTGLYQAWKKDHSFQAVFKRYMASKDKAHFRERERIRDLEKKDREYNLWKLKNRPDKKKLAEQRTVQYPDMTISVLVPVYQPQLSHLKEMTKSVLAQTYGRFELCLACAPEISDGCRNYLKGLAQKNRNVKVTFLEENLGISGNTNKAAELATGSYLAFADQDDLLAEDILYEYARMAYLNDSDVVYCDEDKLDDETGTFYEPHFKSDYNPDLLCCNNYICHMLMVRSSLAREVGLLDPEMDGAQDHDFLLRLSEKTEKFMHIPKILYSWRSHRGSTAANPESKAYAYVAGKNAIDQHFLRCGIPATSRPMNLPGWYRIEYTLSVKPLVSVLIPNKDHAADLEACIGSIREKSSYTNLEFLIIENGSTEKETFEAYERLKEDGRVRILTWDRPFNYSAINNFAAREARGELLLLLNNDTRLITPDGIESMAGYCMRPDVGAVGAKLYYPDDTVQHAGVLVGVSEGADHVFLNYPRENPGYMGRAVVSQDMSAVTAACMMVRREVYEQAGGMEEEYTVAYNDVDFCLKLQENLRLRVVFDAFSEWYHAESKTRGYEETPEQKERFEKEKALLRERFRVRMKQDPYYNRNLSLKHGYYER